MVLAPGGRVTDYRFTDLGELMKFNRLAPWYGTRNTTPPHPDDPLEKAYNRLSRYTLKCPLTISSTTIFNMVPTFILMQIKISIDPSIEGSIEVYESLLVYELYS